MKTVCVYHSIDLDGWMSAAIVKYWFEKQLIITNSSIDSITDKIDFIGYNYGQPIPDLSEYDKVIMCDISFSIEEMENLRQHLQDNFIWIDHHISAIKSADERTNNYYDGIRDAKFAACELTWKYFFPDEPMPEIVRLLGMYDSFRHKGTDEELKVLEFQYGARTFIKNYDDAYESLKINLLDDECEIVEHEREDYIIHDKGIAIYQYLCTEAKQTYKNGFKIGLGQSSVKLVDLVTIPDTEPETLKNAVGTFLPYKFICINKERFNPINFGIDYHKDGYDGCACFYFDGTSYNFSLYNDNGEVDCSIIAKQFGGGGHKGAAGFRLNNEDFNKLIFNNTPQLLY